MCRTIVPLCIFMSVLVSCVAAPEMTPTPIPTATERPPTSTPRPPVPLPEIPTVTATGTVLPMAGIATAPAATSTPSPSPTPLLLPTSLPVRPQRPTPVPTSIPVSAHGWRAEYFANPNLSGQPVLVRTDTDINFDWDWAAPAAGLPADHFSVRWTRQVALAAGQWRFQVTVDDGVRVYVDGLPIIDRWHPSAAVTYNSSLALSEGMHLLRVDYYDNGERATVRVRWLPEDGSPTDPAHAGTWRGDYFGNRDLAGTPAFSRDDAVVYFDWGDGGPGGGLRGQDFSARWTRQIFFPGGRYQFRARADDGVRVWLDWAAIIDEWHPSAGDVSYVRELDVADGNHAVVVEYFQAGGAALVQVGWQPMHVNWVANLYTCQLEQDSWIKIYRLTPHNRWEDLRPEGYGPNAAGGQLTLFGLPVDAAYGWDGQPYKVELWIKGQLVRSEGDIFAGQEAFRLMPGADVRTSWPCGAALPRP